MHSETDIKTTKYPFFSQHSMTRYRALLPKKKKTSKWKRETYVKLTGINAKY